MHPLKSGGRRKADRLYVALLENGYFENDRISDDAGDRSSSIAAFVHRSVIGGDAGRRAGDDRNNAWLTPSLFVDRIRAAFGGTIDFDPCTEPDNPARAKRYCTLSETDCASVGEGASSAIRRTRRSSLGSTRPSKSRQQRARLLASAGQNGRSLSPSVPCRSRRRACSSAVESIQSRGRRKQESRIRINARRAHVSCSLMSTSAS